MPRSIGPCAPDGHPCGRRPTAAHAPAGRLAQALRLAGKRLSLPLAFGCAMACALASGWLALGRGATPQLLTAALAMAAAGTATCTLAVLLAPLWRRKPWSARFAAACLLLGAGTPLLMAQLVMWQPIAANHDLSHVPFPMLLSVIAVSSAAALYNLLTIAGPWLMPLGLPLVALFAGLIARRSR